MTAALAKPMKQREIVDRLAVYERLMALAETGEPDRRLPAREREGPGAGAEA